VIYDTGSVPESFLLVKPHQSLSVLICDLVCPPNSSEHSRISERSSQHAQGGSAEQVGGVVHHPLVRAGSSDHRGGSADRSHHSTRSHRPEYSNKHAGLSERGHSDTHHAGFSERHHGGSHTHSGDPDGYPGQRDFKHAGYPNEYPPGAGLSLRPDSHLMAPSTRNGSKNSDVGYPPGFSEYPPHEQPIAERSSRHEHGGSATPRKERGGAEASSGAHEHAARENLTGNSDYRAARAEWQAHPPRGMPEHPRALSSRASPGNKSPKNWQVFCRANMARIRQSRPDSDLVFQVKVVSPSYVGRFWGL